jgi:hypothetical protein
MVPVLGLISKVCLLSFQIPLSKVIEHVSFAPETVNFIALPEVGLASLNV